MESTATFPERMLAFEAAMDKRHHAVRVFHAVIDQIVAAQGTAPDFRARIADAACAHVEELARIDKELRQALLS
jgi:hypothetical protein